MSRKSSSRIPWTQEEDDALREAVAIHNGKNWKSVAQMIKTRTRAQCAHRWQKVLDPDIKKGPWTADEDELLIQALKQHGQGKWSLTAESVPGRNGKQCRERWYNHLQPNVNKAPWSAEEDNILRTLAHSIGNKWATIAQMLPGRTENAIKNRWNAKLSGDRTLVSEDEKVVAKEKLGRVLRKRSSSNLSLPDSVNKKTRDEPIKNRVLKRADSINDLSPFSSLSLLVQSAEIMQAEEEKKQEELLRSEEERKEEDTQANLTPSRKQPPREASLKKKFHLSSFDENTRDKVPDIVV